MKPYGTALAALTSCTTLERDSLTKLSSNREFLYECVTVCDQRRYVRSPCHKNRDVSQDKRHPGNKSKRTKIGNQAPPSNVKLGIPPISGRSSQHREEGPPT